MATVKFKKGISVSLAACLAISILMAPAYAGSIQDAVDDLRNEKESHQSTEYTDTEQPEIPHTLDQSKEETNKDYEDVKTGHWAYNNVMYCKDNGLMVGTSETTFNPEGTITASEYLTVLVRMSEGGPELAERYKDEGPKWYAGYYRAAIELGIVYSSEYRTAEDTAVGIPREQMALWAMRVLDNKGYGDRAASVAVNDSAIPDYNSISKGHTTAVKEAYGLGILVGTNDIGSFNPQGTLTRQEAATVFARIDQPNTWNTTTPEAPQSAQTFNEGAAHREAKVGDTVISVSGEKIVITETHGVLGAYQGVDIHTGTTLSDGSARKEGVRSYDGTYWMKDSITGEMHSAYEWGIIENEGKPDYHGKDGEVYKNWWQYDGDLFTWIWLAPC